MLLNTKVRYGAIAQLLHWLIVGLIITQFVLANIFEDLPLSMEKIKWIVRHKEIGMTIFMLAIFRLLWRFFNVQPELPAGMKSYEQKLAHITHWLLYVLILALPLSGWLMSSAAKIPLEYFGWFTFPDLVSPDKQLVEITKVIHESLVITLLITVFLHAAAALKHHFVLKDDVLKRMLPRFK